MKWGDFHNFHRVIGKDKFSLFYAGGFSDEITIRLIDLSELSFSKGKSEAGMRKKVSFLMAECFQNIIRHTDNDSAAKVQAGFPGFFMTRNINGNYYIASSNLVQNREIGKLQSKIDDINNLSRNELKSLYMKVLGTEGMSAKGGAGLGLIDMARKSGRKLEAEFRRINNRFTNFFLQVTIQEDIPRGSLTVSHLEESRAIYLEGLLRRNNVIMAYQGNFMQDSILPILTMIDQNIGTHPNGKSYNKNLYHIMVEILQNIMHHGFTEGDKTEGMFVISVSNDCFYINTANYVAHARVKTLKQRMERYLSMDALELKDLYKEILRNGPAGSDGGAGLGLIDIIRLSRMPPEISFKKVDRHKTMYCLKVMV